MIKANDALSERPIIGKARRLASRQTSLPDRNGTRDQLRCCLLYPAPVIKGEPPRFAAPFRRPELENHSGSLNANLIEIALRKPHVTELH